MLVIYRGQTLLNKYYNVRILTDKAEDKKKKKLILTGCTPMSKLNLMSIPVITANYRLSSMSFSGIIYTT